MSNPASTSSVSFGTKLVRFFARLLVTLIIASLTTLTVYLLSRENARTFSLHVVEDTLIIHKGKYLPFGSAPWNTEDEAYAPLPLEGFQPPLSETSTFTDIRELDRALFPVLEFLIRARVLSEDPINQKRGIDYLHRAELLKGLGPEQQLALKALRAESAFYVARTRLSEAESLLQETIHQLKLATQTPNRNTPSAEHALKTLEPALQQLGLSIQNTRIYHATTPP
ncbi:MAG: IF-2 protein, partial [Proteobacteria bacterium]|nr:IF-2 protein [Cystobacterineae bacterium]MCL2314493.1 IF-2 protein [Pseudomonadota bacterium]